MTKRDLQQLTKLYAYLYNHSCNLDNEFIQIKQNMQFRRTDDIDYYELLIKQTEIKEFNKLALVIKQYLEPLIDSYRQKQQNDK